jgi:uridine kinase
MEGLLLFSVAASVTLSICKSRSQQKPPRDSHVTAPSARPLAGGIDLMSLQSDEVQVKPITRRRPSGPNSPNVIVIGIAGGSGSGKTTLADAIYKEVGVENITFISHDSYYRDQSHLTAAERDNLNFDHPDILETDLLVDHIRLLKEGKSVRIPQYDFATHTRCTKTELREPKKIILVEGILIFSCYELVKLLDVKIFVDTADDIRLIRRMQRDATERGRDVPSIITQYLTTVRPMHIEFVEPSKKNADVIVPVGLNSVALDLIVSKLMKDLLG